MNHSKFDSKSFGSSLAYNEQTGTARRAAELFTPEAAGRYIGGDEKPTPASTLQWWRHMGRGPVYNKIGRQVRYRRCDLDAYLEDGIQHPGAA